MAIWQHRKRVLGIFSPHMRRNSYLGTSGQQSEPAIGHWPFDLESVSFTVLLMSDPHTYTLYFAVLLYLYANVFVIHCIY